MQAKADAQLLSEYAHLGSEAAFAEIVARYTDLIYSAVLRQVGCAALAEDVAQSVFTDLARKASSLASTLEENGTIVGWLYRSTRYAVSKHLRTEHRRHIRESQAMQDFDPAAVASPDWEQVRPRLDEALADLGEEDRQAMLLRFFQNQDFQAIGAALEISDDAAQKRVARALEKLRAILARHGITTTAAMLLAVLSTNAIQTAPVGLAARLAGASLAGAATPTAITVTLMTLTSFKAGIIATGIAAGLAVWLTAEYRSLNGLQGENAALSQQISQLRQQPQPSLSSKAASGENSDSGELVELRREHADLLRLRGEVGVLRDALTKRQADLAAAQAENAKMLALREAEAKSRTIRAAVENSLHEVGEASRKYAATNGGLLPTDFGQIPNLVQQYPDLGVGTNSFEILNHGTPLSTKTPPYFFCAREKQARQMPDGIWSRAYLLIDGSVQMAASGDGSYDMWEKEWLQYNQQQGQ